MSSQRSTPMSTPVRKKTPHAKTTEPCFSKSDENMRPGGTPLSHLKTNVRTISSTPPKTPLTSHNRTNKSPQRKVLIKPTTPKNVSSNQQMKPILKNKSSGITLTPKHSTNNKGTTPKSVRTFKSPSRCTTPIKVENSVLVQFSQDIFSNEKGSITPSRSVQSLNEVNLDSYGMLEKLNRSHSASSLFRMKSKDEETPRAKIKRSLSEAKLSLNSSMEPEGETSRLTVGVRVRPLLPREGMNSIQVLNGEVKVASDMGSELSFKYDHCFSSTSSQTEVYEAMVRPLLDNAFQGYNACLFAYGQTGSGKTYSMMGPFAEDDQTSIVTESGMIPRFCQELLEKTAALEDSCPSITTTVEVSYLEVYNEKIHDLLVPGTSQLRVREHPVFGPYVVDLSRHSVNSFDEFQHWITTGNKKRAVASTEMNDKSSRSHSLFTVILTQTFAQVRSDGTWSHDQTRRSQINLVDLAGSERIANTTVSSDRLREGVSINRSLLTLGKVMSALVDKRGFVPYRESVLTWLLKESLGGNSRTCMLATVSPCSNHMDETLSTLRYASQARSIVNRVRVNEAPQDREIRQLREEVERLRGAGERINILLIENEDLREQLKISEDQTKILNTEISKYKQDLSLIEKNHYDLQKNLDRKFDESDSTLVSHEQISKYESEINNCQSKIAILLENNSKLQKQLQEEELKFKQKELQYFEDQKQIYLLKKDVKQLENEICKLKSDLEVAVLGNAELKEELQDKESNITSLNSQLELKNEILENTETSLHKVQFKLEESESELTKAKEKNEALQKKLEELSIKEEKMSQDLEQIPALERALNDYEHEFRKCKSELMESKKTKDELKKKLEDCCLKKLEEELIQCKAQLNEANEIIETERKKLTESIEREELLKIKVEKIPQLETDLRLADAEARKAKRELDEYLAQREELDDSTENPNNGTVYQNRADDTAFENANNDTAFENAGNDTLDPNSVNDASYESESNSSKDDSFSLSEELKICYDKLDESEKCREELACKLNELQSNMKNMELELKSCETDLAESKKKEMKLNRKLEELKSAESVSNVNKERVLFLEEEIKGIKDRLREEKLLREALEGKLIDANIANERLRLKADNAIQLEIELGKCKEELQKLKISHCEKLSESRSREEVIKTDLAARNQLIENLQKQVRRCQDMHEKMMEEKLTLIKVMDKKCCENNSKRNHSYLQEENVVLKKDLALFKEKLSEKEKLVQEKDRKIYEIESLLKDVIRHEERHEKALAEAKMKCDKDAYEFIMDSAYPHHLTYLIRKARKFTEVYKVPYEFELKDKIIIVRHLVLSAKATLSHIQLSKWIERIENEKVWHKSMDRDIPWEVDFGDYYEKNSVQKIVVEALTEADSAITCGVQLTDAGFINPILWRKTMIKRHVMGLKEDSDVLIKYFNEIEDSRIYSILSRIQVSVARLQEATQNVEK